MTAAATKDQLDDLYAVLLKAGEAMLRKSPALHPYAAVVVSGGSVELIAVHPDGFRDADEVEEKLVQLLASEQRAKGHLAAGWAYTVTTRTDDFSARH